MERYLLAILLNSFLVMSVGGNSCKSKRVPLGQQLEMKCDLPQWCTSGEWNKTRNSQNSRILTANDCQRCDEKFIVVDSSSSKQRYSTSSLQVLNATWNVEGTYKCSCKDSSRSSDGLNKTKCFKVSVYLNCQLNITINGVENVVKGSTLIEEKRHTFDVEVGTNVGIKCSKDERRNIGKKCTKFQKSEYVTVDKSDHHCKVVCVRKESVPGHEDTDTCRVSAILNVKNNSSSRIFYRNIAILNVVTLSIVCVVLSGGCYLFHRRKVCNPDNNQDSEEYYAIGGMVSEMERTRRGQTYSTHLNPLEDTVENANVKVNHYLEITDERLHYLEITDERLSQDIDNNSLEGGSGSDMLSNPIQRTLTNQLNCTVELNRTECK